VRIILQLFMETKQKYANICNKCLIMNLIKYVNNNKINNKNIK